MEIAKQILETIQGSIDDFNGSIPGLQKSLYKELVKELQKLQTREGNILSNVSNLKLIGSIRNKLEKIILNKDYITSVEKYINAFDQVSSLQTKYFADFNKGFKPAKTLKIVRDLAVDATLNSLTETGLQANVIEPVNEMLRVNITGGGSYPDLLDGLRIRMITDGNDLGHFERYTKQITTDALNTYSANYHSVIAEDLGLKWFRYTGSLLTTSREFCIKLTEKDFVHQSEIPTILKGMIDGHQCHMNKKTELPDGLKAETNKSNFMQLRGGFQCGHQFFAVPNAIVPQALKDKIKKIT